MADVVKVEIVGLPELLQKLERLRVPPEDVEVILYKAAKELQTGIRAAAPVGKTGNLRRGIVAKKQKGNVYFRSAFAATDFWKAPHDHLVEFGHRIVSHKGADTGKRAKANAFFWPIVQRELPAVGEGIVKELSEMILDRMK